MYRIVLKLQGARPVCWGGSVLTAGIFKIVGGVWPHSLIDGLTPHPDAPNPIVQPLPTGGHGGENGTGADVAVVVANEPAATTD